MESAYAQHIKTITLKLYRMRNSKTYLCATVLATLFMACNKDSNLMTTESPEDTTSLEEIFSELEITYPGKSDIIKSVMKKYGL